MGGHRVVDDGHLLNAAGSSAGKEPFNTRNYGTAANWFWNTSFVVITIPFDVVVNHRLESAGTPSGRRRSNQCLVSSIQAISGKSAQWGS